MSAISSLDPSAEQSGGRPEHVSSADRAQKTQRARETSAISGSSGAASRVAPIWTFTNPNYGPDRVSLSPAALLAAKAALEPASAVVAAEAATADKDSEPLLGLAQIREQPVDAVRGLKTGHTPRSADWMYEDQRFSQILSREVSKAMALDRRGVPEPAAA